MHQTLYGISMGTTVVDIVIPQYGMITEIMEANMKTTLRGINTRIHLQFWLIKVVVSTATSPVIAIKTNE